MFYVYAEVYPANDTSHAYTGRISALYATREQAENHRAIIMNESAAINTIALHSIDSTDCVFIIPRAIVESAILRLSVEEV